MNRFYINTASFAAFLSKNTKWGLYNTKIFTILFLLLVFCGKMQAQCSITASTNASTLNNANVCTTFSGCTTLYVGNGSTLMTLTLNEGLNLTCLGAINFIITNNATIVFGNSANDKLTLAEGSSITVNAGGSLSGGNNCTSSDRIVIGTNLVSTCDGNAGTDLSFPDIINLGGTGSATSNSPICNGNTINFRATPPPNGGPYTYLWSGPNSFSSTSQNPSVLATTSPNTSGLYSVSMTSTTLSSNKTVVAQTTVVVNSGSGTSAPTVTTTQPTCTVPTGTITVTAPTGMNYSIDGLTYTNTSGIFTSLASGTYSVTAKNSSGCISNATSVTITSPIKTWNGSVNSDWNTAANWTPNGVPTSSSCVTIPNTVRPSIISGANFVAYANTLTILDSGSLTVKATNTITVTDFVNVGLGFLIFEDTSSLVQINNVANSGYIDYIRTTTARPTDYTYWSSPVAPMTLGELYPAGSSFYSYEATSSTEDWKQETAGTDMIAGKGYIANRGAVIPSPGAPPPPDLLEFTFTGVPNNGSIAINGVFADKSYLLGNPYPSALDADAFLVANSGVLNGTLYFWTHNTTIGTNVPNPGSGVYAYSSNDYATYNATGGVGAAPPDSGTSTSPATSGGPTPTGKIASGQGFFASTKTSLSGTSIVFNNTMRVAGNNSQFFKKRGSKTEKVIEKNRIWLNLTNTQGAFKQTLVGYITDATNDYDDRFDGESFDGNEFVDFYSLNQDKNLVIQGRALPFDENDEIPLGYRTTINGDFTINIDQADGLLINQTVFLEDKLTQKVFDLKSGNYTFSTAAGTFNDRFVLRYTNKTLGTKNFETTEKTVLVSNKNKQIQINSFAETIDKVEVYDLLGRQIYQKTIVNSNELSISNLVSSRQALVVKTSLHNGETVTIKIIY